MFPYVNLLVVCLQTLFSIWKVVWYICWLSVSPNLSFESRDLDCPPLSVSPAPTKVPCTEHHSKMILEPRDEMRALGPGRPLPLLCSPLGSSSSIVSALLTRSQGSHEMVTGVPSRHPYLSSLLSIPGKGSRCLRLTPCLHGAKHRGQVIQTGLGLGVPAVWLPWASTKWKKQDASGIWRCCH